MKSVLKRTAAGVLAASILMLSGCHKVTRREAVKIEEGTPWYESAITTVDTGLKPEDFLFLDTRALGMAGDMIVFSSAGLLIWDPYDFESVDDAVTYIHVYDVNGNHIFDKDMTAAVYEYNPKAEKVIVQSLTILPDSVRVNANWYEGEEYRSQELTFDLNEQKITSSKDRARDIEAAQEDIVELQAWSADGYSIRHSFVFDDLDYTNHLEFTSASGEVKDICLEDTFKSDMILNVLGFMYFGEGRFCFKLNTYSMQNIFYYLDVNTGKAADISEIPEFSWISNVVDAWEYMYYDGVGNIATSQHGIKLLDMDAKTSVDYIDYDQCDINRFDAASLSILKATEDSVILAGSSVREQFGNMNALDIHQRDTLIVVLKKTDTNPHIGKTILKAASVEPLSYSMAEAIRQFNNTDSEAFIMLDPKYDYETVASQVERDLETDDETYDRQVRSAMMDTLSIDLIAGDGPDIILGTMDYTQLNKSDLLLDLSDEVKVSNVYSNIMDLAKTDKKLYQVPLTFGLEGTLANRSDVDPNAIGFTFDSYKEYVSGPCNGRDPNRMAQLEFLCTCLAQMSSTFQSSGGFDYDNNKFAQVAEFVDGLVLPSESELMYEEIERYNSTAGKAPDFVNIGSGMDLLNVTHNGIAEKVVMGFPSLEPKGLMVKTSQSIGISAATSSPDACKRFVSMLVGDEMQSLFARYDGISINKQAQADACRAFAARSNAAYESISKVWDQQDIVQLQVFDTICDPELLVTQMDSYISSASGLHRIDAAVEIIIREEIQAYFADQKSIDEVMDIIQNRVDLYVRERG